MDAFRDAIVVAWRLAFGDQLAPKALVEALGVVVLDEFANQASQVALAENHEMVQTLVPNRPYKPFRVLIGESRRLHLMRTVRPKPFG
jgi:hypothetical protein